MNKQLVEAMVDIREEDALRIVEEAIRSGEDPFDILDSCQEGMKTVGERFEKQEYFLPELIASGEMLRKVSDIVKPHLAKKAKLGEGKQGRIVLGTVRGDIHDIGKDIVKLMLDVNGFEVRDLGVDVPEDAVVAAVKEFKPEAVALSGLLTLAYDTMKSTVEALEKAGLRKNVKVMIGGGQVDERVREYVRADAFGLDAMAAVRLARGWTGG
ncbi:MAG: cobalamin B12-binding domain-containing protein [Chloroflexi bacterium]|nr:cobalamin B12-binding domain-containing protein [Chloroflexota bacterium]